MLQKRAYRWPGAPGEFPVSIGEIAKWIEKFKETHRIGEHARRNQETVVRSTCSGLCLLPTLTPDKRHAKDRGPDMGNWPPLSGNSLVFENQEALLF
jgi:hypothetical protein